MAFIRARHVAVSSQLRPGSFSASKTVRGTLGALTALTALVVCGALSGCANSAKLTYLPSGDAGFAINCSGGDASSGWGDCYKQASDACGTYGYDVISKDDEKGSTSGGSLIGVFGANIKNRSMVIKCRQ